MKPLKYALILIASFVGGFGVAFLGAAVVWRIVTDSADRAGLRAR